MKKAISVLSGGLDCTVATSVYSKDYEIHAITFNYGQKSFKRELQASKEICENIKKMNWTIWKKAKRLQKASGFLQEIWCLHQLQHHLLKALALK